MLIVCLLNKKSFFSLNEFAEANLSIEHKAKNETHT